MNISTASKISRLLQLVVALISLVLTAQLAKDGSSLVSQVDSINQLITDDVVRATEESMEIGTPSSTNGFHATSQNPTDQLSHSVLSTLGLNISTSWDSSILSFVSSGITLVNNPLLSVFKRLVSRKLQSFYDGSVLRVGEIPYSSLHLPNHGIARAQFFYLSYSASSEFALNLVHFSNSVYQTAKYGSWDCSEVSSLLQQYQLDKNYSSAAVADFFKRLSDNDTASSVDQLEDAMQFYLPANFSELLQTDNVDITIEKSQLFLDLSSNCTKKKANMAISYILWGVYMVSTGLISYTGVVFNQVLNKKYRSILETGTKEMIESSHLGYDELSLEEALLLRDQIFSAGTSLSGSIYLVYTAAGLFPQVKDDNELKHTLDGNK
ncbi:BA75_02960T0 [Komagataella pastoris]|uniref:BA75_02960T0 n=1 Tax=Komagataella pastoris TaxID=4922 RepID=A0A1B2JDZ8_PICPA|nr:BA75_02960T0 [Komagataella pastoris]